MKAIILTLLLTHLLFVANSQEKASYHWGTKSFYKNEIPQNKRTNIKSLSVVLTKDDNIFPNEQTKECINIETLSITGESLKNNGDLFSDNSTLTKLILDTIHLKKMKKLQKISIGLVSFDEVFEMLSVLPSLKTIQINLTDIDSITFSLSYQKSLENLSLWGNKISYICDSIYGLNKLKSIELSNNQLTSFPECLAQFKNLETINLSNQYRFTFDDFNLYSNELDFNSDADLKRLNTCLQSIPNLKKYGSKLLIQK